ncbi:MAG: hypothetical protein VR70_02045 [Rhodospirillaceae bacterium BRH_c57]|nr:MAG: hypothetical protein VR70_02045 [Rhodospirillaceae bacterium BRH_c57]
MATTPQTPRDGFGGIAFLHTAPGHVATFGVLMTDMAPNIPVRQTVKADLLEAARQAGGLTPEIAALAREALEDLAANGARVVVCTCSTVGGCVSMMQEAGMEEGGMQEAGTPRFLRIDAPMAQAAVRIGGRILVVATVEESLASARGLIERTAETEGRPVDVRGLLVPGAWPLFAAGDRTGYRRTVVATVRAAAGDVDAVVLAQASMATAADELSDLSMPVLCSPRAGVTKAIATWRATARDSAEIQG